MNGCNDVRRVCAEEKRRDTFSERIMFMISFMWLTGWIHRWITCSSPCFPFAGQFSFLCTATATFVIFSIASCCWTFLSTFIPPLPFSDLSSHNRLSWGLPRLLHPTCFFDSDRFGYHLSFILTMCPADFIRLLTILPTMQALKMKGHG